jgi:hypothetical protein
MNRTLLLNIRYVHTDYIINYTFSISSIVSNPNLIHLLYIIEVSILPNYIYTKMIIYTIYIYIYPDPDN